MFRNHNAAIYLAARNPTKNQGAILGVLLATAARLGPRPKRSVGSLLRPIAVLFGGNAIFACLAGSAGYIAATNGWVWLVGRIAKRVPPEKHIAFLIDLWAHGASYLGGFVGGIMLAVWVWRSRGGSPVASDQ